MYNMIAINLNTSHVILYLEGWDPQVSPWTNLNTSHVILYRIVASLAPTFNRFKYISCYSLSDSRAGIILKKSDLNTSHVILYQRPQRQRRNGSNLNTSHVILYPDASL